MTDTQILAIAISVTFPVLGVIGAIIAVLYNNKRMDDLKADLREFKADMGGTIENGFAHMELLLKLHEAEHHKK